MESAAGCAVTVPRAGASVYLPVAEFPSWTRRPTASTFRRPLANAGDTLCQPVAHTSSLFTGQTRVLLVCLWYPCLQRFAKRCRSGFSSVPRAAKSSGKKRKKQFKPGKRAAGKPAVRAGTGQQPLAYPAEDVFSLDVECVAVGTTHEKSDREPCSLALVNGYGRTIMQALIKPEKPVVSYLTPFTGLRAQDLEGGRGISLSRAINELKKHLPGRAILVGQNPEGDADWMHLKHGVDFREFVDLSEVFRNNNGVVFSLRHEALVLLGKEPASGVHDPSWDAATSMELYNLAAKASSRELDKMRERLTHREVWPPKPSLARAYGYQIDGVCLSCYMKKHCSCGRPTQAD